MNEVDVSPIRFTFLLHVKNHAGSVGKFRQALAVHAVIHERSAPLRKHEPAVAKNLQVMRYRRLLNGKVLYDLANADRIVVAGEQVENANAHRIGKGFEATGVFPRARIGDLRRLHLGTTAGGVTFGGR